jgi:hypothetical protein
MIHNTRYPQMLRLRRIQPGPGISFVLSDGVMALAVLLALAELAPWPVIVILPVTVASVVKFGDEVLLAAERWAGTRRPASDESTPPAGIDEGCGGTVYRSTAVSSKPETGDTGAPSLALAAVDFSVFAARRSRWMRRGRNPDARGVGVNQRPSLWIGPHTETPPQH